MITQHPKRQYNETVHISTGEPYCDQVIKTGLSGTIILSAQAIAVFSGEACAYLQDHGNYSCDQIVEKCRQQTLWTTKM
jgi:hypothetical protein